MTPDEKQKFINASKDDKATFFFVPNAILKEKLAKGDDPILNKLPEKVISGLLICGAGAGILLEPAMVLKYIDGNLDKDNSYVFSMGEIRVVGAGDMIIKTT